MPTPPALSDEQRHAAYEKALELRQERATLKYHVGQGFPLFDAWTKECAQGMKVYDLLTALNGIGPKTAQRLLKDAGIPEKNTVRACGPRQTDRLFDLLAELGRR